VGRAKECQRDDKCSLSVSANGLSEVGIVAVVAVNFGAVALGVAAHPHFFSGVFSGALTGVAAGKLIRAGTLGAALADTGAFQFPASLNVSFAFTRHGLII